MLVACAFNRSLAGTIKEVIFLTVTGRKRRETVKTSMEHFDWEVKILQGCKLNFNLRLYVKVMTASTKLKLNLRLSGLEPTIFCESNCPSDGFESRAQSNGAAGSSPVGGVFLIGVVLFLFFSNKENV